MIVNYKQDLFQLQHLSNRSIIKKAIETAVHYYKTDDGAVHIELLAHVFRVAQILNEHKADDYLVAAAILQHLPDLSKYNPVTMMDTFGIDTAFPVFSLNCKQDAYLKMGGDAETWSSTKDAAAERYLKAHNDELKLMLADDLDIIRQFDLRKKEYKYPVWARNLSLFDLHWYFCVAATNAQMNKNRDAETNALAAQILRYSNLFLQVPRKPLINVHVASSNDYFGLMVMRLLSNVPYYRISGLPSTFDGIMESLAEKPADVLFVDYQILKDKLADNVRQIKSTHPAIKILLLGMVDHKAEVMAIQDHAEGFVGAAFTADEFILAINKLAEGGYYYSFPVRKKEIKNETIKDHLS